jgi:hypothetical protein
MAMSGNAPPPGAGYGAAPPPPPPGYGYGGQPPRSNQKAVWSLVLGILGLVCCGFVTGIPALILGKMAQNEIDGIIAIVFGIISVILFATGALSFDSYS